MTSAGWTALAICVFGAFSYGAGSILQAVGARRSAGTVRTLGHPLYLIGVVCDLLAWAGSMVALRELAVYQVESILAGSLAVTVVAARIFLASRVRGRDVAAIAVTIAALTVLAMSAGPQQPVIASSGLRLAFCAAALGTAVIGWGVTKVGSPGLVATLAGLALGAAALAGRALSMPAQPMQHPGGALLAIVTEPITWALVVFAATGMLMYTDALQHGQVGPVTAVLWISEVAAPSALALAFLGDAVRSGWGLAAALAGVFTVGAALVLATAPAATATAAAHGEMPQPALAGVRAPAALAMRPTGTLLWWGSPTNPLPIWRPPSRSHTARPAPAPAREPVWDLPGETPQPVVAVRRGLAIAAEPYHRPPRQQPPQTWQQEQWPQEPALPETRPWEARPWEARPWSADRRPVPPQQVETQQAEPERPAGPQSGGSPWAEPPLIRRPPVVRPPT
jgi:hypothetical protein